MADSSKDAGECELIWNPPNLTLDDLAKFMSLVAELYTEVAVPYVTDELFQPGSNVVPSESPLVASVRMGSPLVTQLLAGPNGILSLGMVGFILKNPKLLARFLPRFQGTWHEERQIAMEKKFRYIDARDRIEARGQPIERFEREYRSRELRSTRARKPGRSPR
jgi:hypothetical protein